MPQGNSKIEPFPTDWTIPRPAPENTSSDKQLGIESPSNYGSPRRDYFGISQPSRDLGPHAITSGYIRFNPHSRAPLGHFHPKTRALVGGQGHVVTERYVKALHELKQCGLCTRVAFFGTELNCRFAPLADAYFPVSPTGPLPLEAMADAGYIAEDCLGVVASPINTHLPVASQLTAQITTAVEKALTETGAEATQLKSLSNGNGHYIDHKVWCHDVQRALIRYRINPRALDNAVELVGYFFEKEGFSIGRSVEDTIIDCIVHLYGVMVALLTTSSLPFEIGVNDVNVARHSSDAKARWQTPQSCTAAMATGRIVRLNAPPITYRLMQAKCVPDARKEVILRDRNGTVIDRIDLNESGWMPHFRALKAMLQPGTRLPLTFDDGVLITHLADICRDRAEQYADYAVHHWPAFLTGYSNGYSSS